MAKKKNTKLIPNGIYLKKIQETEYWATCISVQRRQGVVTAILSMIGYPDQRLIEGSEEANTWKRVKRMKAEPFDLAEFIEDVGEVIDVVTDVVLGGIKAADEIDDAIKDIKKPRLSVSDITQSGPMGPKRK